MKNLVEFPIYENFCLSRQVKLMKCGIDLIEMASQIVDQQGGILNLEIKINKLKINPSQL